uniref:Diphthamide biosynthesis protein 3 n=1 Tax=Anthurium amnicola TaxID=1678845 RepID=A0A1D1YFI0_9ARAE
MITLQISVVCPASSGGKRSCLGLKPQPPVTCCCSHPRRKVASLHGNERSVGRFVERHSFPNKGGVVLVVTTKGSSVVVVRANQGGGFDFNGGGGGGWDRNTTARALGNLALAIALTYLTMTGQLGWLLDAIVSIWLLAVLLPIVGLGAFFWLAGRDIVQDSCPNCGNGFQIFKSSLKDGVQFCPFCTQPFSVQGNKFVREPSRFSSNRSPKFGEAFNGFSRQSEKGGGSSATIVDIEAEVKDID